MNQNEEEQKKSRLKEYAATLLTGLGMSVGAGISSWLVKVQTNVLEEDISWQTALWRGYLDEYLYMHHPEAMIGIAMVFGFIGGIWIIQSNKDVMNL